MTSFITHENKIQEHHVNLKVITIMLLWIIKPKSVINISFLFCLHIISWYWKKRVGLGLCQFRQYFSYIMAVSFIGGENWSAQRKPPTCRKWLTNFITLHLYVICSTPRHGYAYFVIQLNIANCKLLFPFQQKKRTKSMFLYF